jgi:hypothetical protein
LRKTHSITDRYVKAQRFCISNTLSLSPFIEPASCASQICYILLSYESIFRLRPPNTAIFRASFRCLTPLRTPGLRSIDSRPPMKSRSDLLPRPPPQFCSRQSPFLNFRRSPPSYEYNNWEMPNLVAFPGCLWRPPARKVTV